MRFLRWLFGSVVVAEPRRSYVQLSNPPPVLMAPVFPGRDGIEVDWSGLEKLLKES